METNNTPSAKGAGNDDRPESNLDIGARALSQRLLTEVTELVSRYIEALPDAIDIDWETENAYFLGTPEFQERMRQSRRHLREGTVPSDWSVAQKNWTGNKKTFSSDP